jgi:hypothetical protein
MIGAFGKEFSDLVLRRDETSNSAWIAMDRSPARTVSIRKHFRR